MKTSSEGIKLIQKFEGCKLKAYKCPAGVWTIGYGHTGKVDGKKVCSGMKITKQKAVELLEKDLEKFERYVSNKSYVPFKLTQNQFDALVSFTYNLGQGCLKTLCNGRTAKQVANKITLYNKAGGKVLNGLVRRRKAEQKLFLK